MSRRLRKRQPCIDVVILAWLITCTNGCEQPEPGRVCDGTLEVDFSPVGLVPGLWTCPFGGSLRVDESGRPRWLETNPVRRVNFDCDDRESLPLVVNDPNIKEGEYTLDVGDELAYVRKLVRVAIDDKEAVLAYELGYSDSDRPSHSTYGFRMEDDGRLAYYLSRVPSSQIVWQYCVDHPESGAKLETSEDELRRHLPPRAKD